MLSFHSTPTRLPVALKPSAELRWRGKRRGAVDVLGGGRQYDNRYDVGERKEKKKSGRCHSGSLSAVNIPNKQLLKPRLVRMTLQRTRLGGGGAGCEAECTTTLALN